MRFLIILFWIMALSVVGIFSWNNWNPVTVMLWDGLVMDTKLPVLLIASLLIGLVPYYLIHRATRWSLRRKLETAERTVSELRATTPPPRVAPTVAPTAPNLSTAMPPVGAPIAVPPGVS
jgi:lipopolysaccharide assembly protein A